MTAGFSYDLYSPSLKKCREETDGKCPNGKPGFGLGQRCPADESQLPEFGWGGAAGAYYFIDLKNGITAYFATHVLGYKRFQQARGIIADIAEKILVD